MKRAIYPGSFDPVTFGHLDMIERSAKMVDELTVAILVNHAKNPLFSIEERVKMLEEMTDHLSNVTIQSFDGLTIDYARSVTDFEYELQIAQTNRIVNPEIDTMFLTTSLEYAYLSSTIVKEIASYGGDISKFVPLQLMERIYAKYDKNKE